MKKIKTFSLLVCLTLFTISCKQNKSADKSADKSAPSQADTTQTTKKSMQEKVDAYATVTLTTDLTAASANQKKMLGLMIDAAKIMDSLYAYQTYGQLDSLLRATSDKATRQFIKINYGPWDRLNDNKPFIPGVGSKPLGANFYPDDMSKKEFKKAELPHKKGLYNFIRRNKDGALYTLPYHKKFESSLKQAADLLRQAAELAETEGLKKYLNLRAEALTTDKFRESDLAWLEMRDNSFGIIIGPIETYEDQLFGYKASYEGIVLHKDKEWSQRLKKYVAHLPELQDSLPVPDQYKQEEPGTNADLNAYNVVFYAGAANAGGKTIAINLPNDEEVQLQKGTRRLQLKNVMKAKFDKILVPIAEVLITPEQRKYVTFDAFFANTMFHEVAHGLGIKNTIDGEGTVRDALKEHASAMEEGKADVVGLYMVEQLLDKGIMDGNIKDYYVTFIASIFRSVRFGAGDAHGVANMVRFNYFKEHGAFKRLEDGTYKINFEKTEKAVHDLSHLILTLQGDGDYKAVDKLIEEKGHIGQQLQSDLKRLAQKDIPVDVVFKQGKDVLGI